MPTPTVYLEDNFTASAGTLLTAHTSDSGGTWAGYNGAQDLTITADGFITTVNGASVISSVPLSGDYDIIIKGKFGTDISPTFVFAWNNDPAVGPDTTYYRMVWASNTYYFQCQQNGGAVLYNQTSFNHPPVAGHEFEYKISYRASTFTSTFSAKDITAGESSWVDIHSFVNSTLTSGRFVMQFAPNHNGDTSGVAWSSVKIMAPRLLENGAVFVTVDGNDATGTINDSTKPFRTINAALEYLAPGTSSARNMIHIGPGRFAPVNGAIYYSSAGTAISNYAGSYARAHTIWVGSGQPLELANGRGLNDTTGTVIDGPLAALVSGIEFYDFGVDTGIDVVTSRYAGATVDGFIPCWALDQNPNVYPPVADVVGKNITVISTAGTPAHCFLSENCTNAYFQNIRCILGFAVVAKTWNSTYKQFTCLGQGAIANYAFIAKANAYSPAHDLDIEDVYMGPFNATGTGAQSQGAGSFVFTAIGDGNNSTGQPHPSLYNVSARGVVADYNGPAIRFETSNGLTVSNCTASDVLLVGGTSAGTATGTGNSISLASAPATSVDLTRSGYLFSAIVNPTPAPDFVRFSTNVGKIDSYTGALDLTGVTVGTSVTITGKSSFGANGTNVSGVSTFSSGPETVVEPVFSPSAGTYTGTQSVTITTATSGATIRYTLDGSTPSQSNGTVYAGAVSVAASQTLNAIAYKVGSTDSSISSAAFSITTDSEPTEEDYTMSELTDAITSVLIGLGYTSARATKLDSLDTTVSSRLPTSSYTAAPNASSVASAVWSNSTRTITGGGSGSGGVSVIQGPFSLSAEVGGIVDSKMTAYAGDVLPVLVTLRSDSGDLISYEANTLSAEITDVSGAVTAGNLQIESIAPSYGIAKVTVPVAARGTYRLTVRKTATNGDIVTFGAIVITVSNR